MSGSRTRFGPDYWRINYREPETMDGIGNADRHADYLRSLFALDDIQIRSVIDLGFGLGYLFRAVLETFKPYAAYGIEPSTHAFTRARQGPLRETGAKLENIDLQTWAGRPSRTYDLGICTSVLQYLSDADLRRCLPVMAKRIRYLYVTVPTDVELVRQARELDFRDPFALRRSRQAYRRRLGAHFTFVSSRLLESKVHFDEWNTPFTELLFRF